MGPCIYEFISALLLKGSTSHYNRALILVSKHTCVIRYINYTVCAVNWTELDYITSLKQLLLHHSNNSTASPSLAQLVDSTSHHYNYCRSSSHAAKPFIETSLSLSHTWKQTWAARIVISPQQLFQGPALFKVVSLRLSLNIALCNSNKGTVLYSSLWKDWSCIIYVCVTSSWSLYRTTQRTLSLSLSLFICPSFLCHVQIMLLIKILCSYATCIHGPCRWVAHNNIFITLAVWSRIQFRITIRHWAVLSRTLDNED